MPRKGVGSADHLDHAEDDRHLHLERVEVDQAARRVLPDRVHAEGVRVFWRERAARQHRLVVEYILPLRVFIRVDVAKRLHRHRLLCAVQIADTEEQLVSVVFPMFSAPRQRLCGHLAAEVRRAPVGVRPFLVPVRRALRHALGAERRALLEPYGQMHSRFMRHPCAKTPAKTHIVHSKVEKLSLTARHQPHPIHLGVTVMPPGPERKAGRSSPMSDGSFQ